jgi:Holliday junction resolvase-like predicted endonuclease
VREPSPSEEYITVIDSKGRERVQRVEYVVPEVRGEKVYVTAAKQAKLAEVVQTYLQEHDWPGDWRIDVVAVELTRGGVLERVTVIQNAVGG